MRIIVTLALISLASFAHAEKRHAGAHVHGLNHVQIVLDGTTLQVNYEFPIAQLQEHDEHKHDEHKHDKHEGDAHLTAELKEVDNIFELVRVPDSADCAQKKINLSLRDVVTDGGISEESEHKDVVVEALVTCGQPNNVTSFDFTPAFEKFDDLAMIEVEGIVGNRSLSDSLTRERALTSL